MNAFKPGEVVRWRPAIDRTQKGPAFPSDVVIRFGPNKTGEYHVKKVSRYGGTMRTLRVNAKYLEAIK